MKELHKEDIIMKRSFKALITIILSISMLLTMNLSIFADDAQGEETSMDADVVLLINNQLSEEEISIFKNSDNPDIEFSELSNYPILNVFNSPFYYSQIGETLDILLSSVKEDSKKLHNSTYIALDDTPYLLKTFTKDNKTTISVTESYQSSEIPNYILDIMALTKELTVVDKCNLQGVYCFDGSSSHQGCAVYLRTDKGVYVKYYESSASKAILFSENEFRAYASEYYEYLVSDDNNYDEDGEPIVGGTKSFLSFVESINSDAKENESTDISETTSTEHLETTEIETENTAGAENEKTTEKKIESVTEKTTSDPDSTTAGCGSSISGSAVLLTSAAAAYAVNLKRKKKQRHII